KARAALEGISMSDYILRELGKALERPTRAEVLERLRSRPVRRLKRKAADVVRAERDTRWIVLDASALAQPAMSCESPACSRHRLLLCRYHLLDWPVSMAE